MDWEVSTTPISNIICVDPEAWQRQVIEYTRLMGARTADKPVQWHKDVLGPQDRCFTSMRRYWVWSGEGWRVLVNNKAGVAFEVVPTLTPDEAMAAWDDYKSKMEMP
jgi:hypothetical protein